jgi:outer membrane protein W
MAQNKKIGMQLEGGYGMISNKDNISAYELFLSPYYRINDNTSIGVGAGLLGQNKKTNPERIYPVYVHSKYILSVNSNFKPFVNLKAGYGFGSTNVGIAGFDANDHQYSGEIKYRAGLFISPSIGVSYDIAKHHSLFVAISYDFLKVKTENNIRTENAIVDLSPYAEKNSSIIGLRVGYEF